MRRWLIPDARRWLTCLAIAPVVAIGWVSLLPPAPVAQPLPFSHTSHSTMGCAVCHRGVESAARAGLPEAGACVKCHATAPRGVEPAAQWERIAKEGRIPWVRVTHVPEHVLFSHRRHVVLARLDCVSCHGDMARRAAPPGTPPLRLDMDACTACHRDEGASEDCAACHR